VLELATKFVPAADEVFRLQNGTDPECRLFQKFAEQGHYGGRPGTTRQGTYAATPSGELLASINSNDPKRIADMLRRALEKWQTLPRTARLLTIDPQTQVLAIRRAERYYPADGLVLYVTSRDLPREAPQAQPPRSAWHETAWNQDYAWFTKAEARQLLPAEPKVGQKHELPQAVVHRIVCAHLVDNVRGQTTPFEEGHVKKARLTAEVTAVDGSLVSVRLEGESLTADEGPRKHGFDSKLLGKATYDLAKERFVMFEMVVLGSRWGATQNNSRRSDVDASPMGVLFTLAGDGHCERIAPAFNYHRIYRPVVPTR
jgi:hypothetical protein